jgi:two-component system LytT family response regulator
MNLRVLIADDERWARKKLQRYLAHEPDVAAIRECASGAEAIAEIQRERPDILFLDIQMHEASGFEVLERVGPGFVTGLIIVTAHDRYAVQAFDVEATDYLLKPFDRDRFRTAFDRARRRVTSSGSAAGANTLPSLAGLRGRASRIVVHSGRRLVPLQLSEIDWIESSDNHARVHTIQNSLLVRDTLASLEERLDSQQFVRIHRGAIVNINAVTEVRARFGGGYDVQLRKGQTLRVGRTHRHQLLRLFHK